MMINQVCATIKNYFTSEKDRYTGNFKVTDGKIVPQLPLQPGQYYRIIGSVFNDGVHHSGEETLTDEPEFDGAVWLMRVPQDFIDLVTDIENWQEKYGDVDSANMSPYSSESFGGYSYTKAQGFARTGGGMLTSWHELFAERLNQYRKIRVL